MADSEQSELISEFCKVTGVDANRARFYLEANGWNSDIAMSSYFEEAEDDEPELQLPTPAASAFPRAGSPKPIFPPTGGSRIATFASLANSAATDTDEEEGQAFYAGGSERSGQQVIGPGKRRGNEVVEEMFKAVKKFGCEIVDGSAKQPETTKLKAFKGSGFVLGSTPGAGNSSASNDTPVNAEEEQGHIQIRLRLWQNGFTVNDQPLRDYHDPESKAFLEAIRKGEIPVELLGSGKEEEVHLNIEDHSREEYVQRRQPIQAFTGTGFRLGNIVPVVTQGDNKPSEKNAADAQETLKLDESKPITTIQIRLADGTRLIMKANHSHTVGDVRRFIVSARPEFNALVFCLMTSFPTKDLADDSATLEQENLLNSVIVQKMK